jgi:hypothetical protein
LCCSQPDFVSHIDEYLADDKGATKIAACGAIGRLAKIAVSTPLKSALFSRSPIFDAQGAETGPLVGALAGILADRTLEVKRAAAVAVKRVAKAAPAAAQCHMAKLVVPLLKAARDKNSALKTASERAVSTSGGGSARPELTCCVSANRYTTFCVFTAGQIC